MIYKKKRSEVQGLWCRSDKKFYYLETGIHSVRNPLDRIKATLITRGALVYDIMGTRLHEEPVVKMTWAEAEERGYENEAIFLNPHVKAQVDADRTGNTPISSNPWGS